MNANEREIFQGMGKFSGYVKKLVGEAGFEPATFGFGGRHSIQLSYPPIDHNVYTIFLKMFHGLIRYGIVFGKIVSCRHGGYSILLPVRHILSC